MLKFVELYNNAMDEIKKGDMLSAYQRILESIQDIEKNVKEEDLHITYVVNNNKRPLKAYQQNGLGTPVDFKQFERVYYKAGEIAAKIGKTEEAYSHFVNYQKMLMSHFAGDKIDKHLFSFRSFSEHSLDDLSNNTISISRPKVMNDPFDTPLLEWGEYMRSKNPKPHTDAFIESFNGYRIRSFSISKKKRPIHDLLMWAHYAEGHNGFCVEYDFSQEFRNPWISFNYINYDSVDLSKGSLSIKEAFATKSKDWKREHEVRLISYNSDYKEDHLPISLDDKSSIIAVYLGLKCSEERQKKIQSLLKGKKTKLYKMEAVGSAIPYKLKPVLIK